MRIAGMDAAAVVIQTNSTNQGTGNVSTPPVQMTNIQTDSQPQQRSGMDKTEKPIDEKAITDAASKMNKLLEGTNRRVDISVHEKTHEIMVKVVDDKTGEVIREVPPKKILDMVANMMEMAGLIVDERR